MKDKKVLSIALGVVSVFIIGIVVAYAALSTTLNSKFNGVTAGDIRWDVGFNTASSPISGYSSSTGTSCGQAIVTNTGMVTFNQINITTSGAYCQYTIPVTNKGNINSKLTTIEPIKPNNTTCSISDEGAIMTCGTITYRIGTSASRPGTYLDLVSPLVSAGSTREMVIQITYSGTSSATPVTQENAGFIFNFAQA